MADRFPILQLPQKALFNVLRDMGSIECFLFSLCSQRCKRSVAGLKLSITNFVIAFQGVHHGMLIEFDDGSVLDVATLAKPHMNWYPDMEAEQDHAVTYFQPTIKETDKKIVDDREVGVLEEEEMRDMAVEDQRELEEEEEIWKLTDGIIGNRDFKDVEEGDKEDNKVEENTTMLSRVVEEAESVFRTHSSYLPRVQHISLVFDTLSFKGWLDHCKQIYHSKRITTFTFDNIDYQVDMVQLGRILKGMEIHTLIPLIESPEAVQEILALRLPYKRLFLSSSSFRSSMSLQKTLAENIDFVYINGDEHFNAVSITLDDLLISNVRELTLWDPRISEKHLNTFLKCWMRGSNRRLKVLQIDFCEEGHLNEAVILRNIPHGKMSSDYLRKKVIQHGYRHDTQEEAPFICNVVSFDGREATLTFGDTEYGPVCKFFVWD